MANGKPFMGSINLTKLNANAKIGHSSFTRAGKDNDIFVNVTLWLNDEPDKFKNVMSVHLNPAKDSGDEKVYFANFKPSEALPPAPLEENASDIPTDDDLPF
jgi:hypothetical protein